MGDLDAARRAGVIADEAINLARMVAGFAAARPAAACELAGAIMDAVAVAAGVKRVGRSTAVEDAVIFAAKAWAGAEHDDVDSTNDLLDAIDALKNMENAQ